eukprot:6172973-Pleurochrysis_carterae.AAC.1
MCSRERALEAVAGMEIGWSMLIDLESASILRPRPSTTDTLPVPFLAHRRHCMTKSSVLIAPNA